MPRHSYDYLDALARLILDQDRVTASIVDRQSGQDDRIDLAMSRIDELESAVLAILDVLRDELPHVRATMRCSMLDLRRPSPN